jgi:ankyrin repeat protein
VTELVDAIASGDLDRARALVAADPARARERDANGVSAPLLACYHGHRALADELGEAAGELDVFEAAALGRTERLRELLEANPALARDWSADGFTPLHYAAFFGTADAAAALLDHGADAAALGRGFMTGTALHSAVAARQAETARLLLDAGSPVDDVQEGGYTALHGAAAGGDAALVELLLERGADRTRTADDGQTPADMARGSSHPDVAALLEL